MQKPPELTDPSVGLMVSQSYDVTTLMLLSVVSDHRDKGLFIFYFLFFIRYRC